MRMQDESGARYDVIAVTASLPLYDARFERMLTVGGRLFVVVGEAPVMDARLVRRTAEDACDHAEPVRDRDRSADERGAAAGIHFLTSQLASER